MKYDGIRLLCIDPGFAEKSGCGIAYFRPRDGRGEGEPRLERAGVIGTTPYMPLRERARLIYQTLWGPVPGQPVGLLEGCRADLYIVELPRIYPFRKQRGDQNDIVDLAYLAGALDNLGCDGELVPPRNWKGTMDPDAMTRWILTRLDDQEKAVIDSIMPAGKRHNAIDAAGLGLHKLGRLKGPLR